MSKTVDAPEYEDFEDEQDEFDEEEAYLDCALGPDGQCGLAGSEDCDWDCPHSHGPLYAGSNEWHKRHNAGLPVVGCECSECRAAIAKARP